MTHLSPDELVDAVEGTLGPARRAHAEHCAACAEHAARLRDVWRATQEVPIPEPSPLFWAHFSARVHEAIAHESTRVPQAEAPWWQWRVLVPVSALAITILALAATLSREPNVTRTGNVATAVDTPADVDARESDEMEWAALSEILGPVDLEAAHDAGFVALGDAERAAMQLSAAEQEELVRLLQEEMGKVGS